MSATGTVHQQISASLRALIRRRRLGPGDKFLTEREIADRFHTSRPTANKALSSLVSEGILEVRRGAGTFLIDRGLDYDLERLVSFTDKARAAGRKPGTRLLEFRRISAGEAPASAVQALKVGCEAELFVMERIRLADGRPVIHERRHVVAEFCPRMTRKDASGSLYAFWTGRCRLEIAGAAEVIRAINAGRKEAALLQIKSGAACFEITATGHLRGDRPLWHEVTVYRADVYEFRHCIGGMGTGGAAVGALKSRDGL